MLYVLHEILSISYMWCRTIRRWLNVNKHRVEKRRSVDNNSEFLMKYGAFFSQPANADYVQFCPVLIYVHEWTIYTFTSQRRMREMIKSRWNFNLTWGIHQLNSEYKNTRERDKIVGRGNVNLNVLESIGRGWEGDGILL